MAGLDDSDEDDDAQQQQQQQQQLDDGTAEPAAQRQRVVLSDHDSSSESEGEGEDLLEEQEQDYQPMPALDTYEEANLDNREYAVDQEARLAAEAELDRRAGRLDLVERAFAEDDEMELDTAHRDRRRRAENAAYEMEDEIWDEEGFALENFDCPLRTWIATDRPRREIKRRWRLFLTTFTASFSGSLLRVQETAAHSAHQAAGRAAMQSPTDWRTSHVSARRASEGSPCIRDGSG